MPFEHSSGRQESTAHTALEGVLLYRPHGQSIQPSFLKVAEVLFGAMPTSQVVGLHFLESWMLNIPHGQSSQLLQCLLMLNFWNLPAGHSPHSSVSEIRPIPGVDVGCIPTGHPWSRHAGAAEALYRPHGHSTHALQLDEELEGWKRPASQEVHPSPASTPARPDPRWPVGALPAEHICARHGRASAGLHPLIGIAAISFGPSVKRPQGHDVHPSVSAVAMLAFPGYFPAGHVWSLHSLVVASSVCPWLHCPQGQATHSAMLSFGLGRFLEIKPGKQGVQSLGRVDLSLFSVPTPQLLGKQVELPSIDHLPRAHDGHIASVL